VTAHCPNVCLNLAQQRELVVQGSSMPAALPTTPSRAAVPAPSCCVLLAQCAHALPAEDDAESNANHATGPETLQDGRLVLSQLILELVWILVNTVKLQAIARVINILRGIWANIIPSCHLSPATSPHR